MCTSFSSLSVTSSSFPMMHLCKRSANHHQQQRRFKGKKKTCSSCLSSAFSRSYFELQAVCWEPWTSQAVVDTLKYGFTSSRCRKISTTKKKKSVVSLKKKKKRWKNKTKDDAHAAQLSRTSVCLEPTALFWDNIRGFESTIQDEFVSTPVFSLHLLISLLSSVFYLP